MHHTYIDPEHFGIADLVPMKDWSPPVLMGVTENAWMLTRINIPARFRGRGYASAILRRILLDADKEGATLCIHVSPSDGLDYETLCRWYGRYGFASTASGFWIRRPKIELTAYHSYNGEHVQCVTLCVRHTQAWEGPLQMCESHTPETYCVVCDMVEQDGA